MFICLDCGCIFEEGKQYIAEEYETPPYETFYGCPACAGNYVETYRCDSCGNWIDTETYVEIDDCKYCENCFAIKELADN